VQFYGPGNQPMSGPANAEKLRHIYREYLHLFDTMYTQSWRSRQRPAPQMNQAQINLLTQYSHMSVEELRARGTNEDMIKMVERFRTMIQRNQQQQKDFRGAISSVQGGPTPNAPVPPQNGHVRAPSHGLSAPNGIALDNRPNQPFVQGLAGRPRNTPPTKEEMFKYRQIIDAMKQNFLTSKGEDPLSPVSSIFS
jgi:hypothetical protein